MLRILDKNEVLHKSKLEDNASGPAQHCFDNAAIAFLERIAVRPRLCRAR